MLVFNTYNFTVAYVCPDTVPNNKTRTTRCLSYTSIHFNYEYTRKFIKN